MNPVRVFLAVPCFAQQVYCWAAESITNTAIALEKKGWLRQIHYFASSNIVLSRNSLVDIFLKSDCSHLLFADGDGSWPVEAVSAMLAANKPIVSLCFAAKQTSWSQVKAAAMADMSVPDLPAAGAVPVVNGDPSQALKAGLIEMPHVGMGLTLIKREEVFERIKPFCTRYKRVGSDEWSHDWFGHSLGENSEMLAEDLSFCRKAAKAGLKSYLLAGYKTTHFGPTGFVWDQAVYRRVQALPK